MTPKRTLLVLLSTALVVTGCGSTYTKTNFIRSADGICLSTTRAIRSLASPLSVGSSAAQRASSGEYLTRVAELVRAEAIHLSSLRKPQGKASERKLLAEWLAAVRQSGKELAQLGASMRTPGANRVAKGMVALTALPVVALARRYGALTCAGPGASYAPPAAHG